MVAVHGQYKPGDRIAGKVRSLTDYGVFVGIEEGVDGMVHKTDLSWTVKVNNPADMYAKGNDVEAIILSINHDEKKVSLGVKQLFDDPWGVVLEDYRPGTVVEEASILSATEYGTFVRVREGIEALIPAGDIPPGTDLTPGATVRAEVANVDAMDRRITMSMRNVGESVQAEQMQALNREKESRRAATLGDLIKEKLGDKLQTMTQSSPPPAPEPSTPEPSASDEHEQSDPE